MSLPSQSGNVTCMSRFQIIRFIALATTIAALAWSPGSAHAAPSACSVVTLISAPTPQTPATSLHFVYQTSCPDQVASATYQTIQVSDPTADLSDDTSAYTPLGDVASVAVPTGEADWPLPTNDGIFAVLVSVYGETGQLLGSGASSMVNNDPAAGSTEAPALPVATANPLPPSPTFEIANPGLESSTPAIQNRSVRMWLFASRSFVSAGEGLNMRVRFTPNARVVCLKLPLQLRMGNKRVRCWNVAKNKNGAINVRVRVVKHAPLARVRIIGTVKAANDRKASAKTSVAIRNKTARPASSNGGRR